MAMIPLNPEVFAALPLVRGIRIHISPQGFSCGFRTTSLYVEFAFLAVLYMKCIRQKVWLLSNFHVCSVIPVCDLNSQSKPNGMCVCLLHSEAEM